jgi:hypothetical protein
VIKEFIACRTRINAHVLEWVYQTFKLKGFSGDKTVGIKKTTVPMDSGLTSTEGEVPVICDENDEVDEEDELGMTVGGLLDYISELLSCPINI